MPDYYRAAASNSKPALFASAAAAVSLLLLHNYTKNLNMKKYNDHARVQTKSNRRSSIHKAYTHTPRQVDDPTDRAKPTVFFVILLRIFRRQK